jgi:hypothetical protein
MLFRPEGLNAVSLCFKNQLTIKQLIFQQLPVRFFVDLQSVNVHSRLKLFVFERLSFFFVLLGPGYQ